MHNLPTALYRAEQVRELDRITIEEHGIPGRVLMKRAGRAAFRRLLARWPEPARITVLAGTGNNGGDGFVVAGLAAQQGLPATVLQVGNADKISGDALAARQFAAEAGARFLPFSAAAMPEDGVLVDGLLGTGLSGDVRGPYRDVIAAINASALPVLALDIPSGLCSDTGRLLGTAVKADLTVSFIGLKQGLFTGMAADVTGAVEYADLEVPASIFAQVPSTVERLDLNAVAALLPPRQRTAHKGHFGHVFVVGGERGLAGAAAMAAQSATRVGAGLVSCATHPEHVSVIVARSPEVMAAGVISGQELEPLLERATVVVVGPGLGRGPWGEQLLQRVTDLDLPLVLDADALNLLAEGRAVRRRQRDNWILTPHPGEAARLLDTDTATVQADRFAAARELQARYGGAVVLKGSGTLIADGGERLALCPLGNPGMASGGMGDVLSGVLGALLAQGLSVGEAARVGTCLHAAAGDLAAEAGERGTVATDLIPHLRRLANPS